MNIINIKPKEKPPALILFIMFFSIVAASITGSTIKDSVFLSHFEKSFLPLMYVLIAITMTCVIYFYKKLVYQKDQINVIIYSSLIFFASISIFKNNLIGWGIPIFYILIEVITIISIMQFWVLAGEIFNARQAKRIFSIIIAGGSFAGISAGYGIKPFTEVYGISSLINLTLFFIIVTIVMAIIIKPYRVLITINSQNSLPAISVKLNKITPYTKNIALLIALSSFTSKIIDYQFKMTAASTYTSESELVNFFGFYYASTGIFTLIMQFFITGFLLNRFGVLAGLLILPIAVLFGSAGFILVGTLAAVYVTKFSDQVIKFSTNSTIQEILWLPLSSKYKEQIKPSIDGSLKTIFEGLAGLLIFLIIYFKVIPESKIYLLSILTIMVAIIWIWNSFRLKKGYVSSLVKSIENRQLDLDKIEIDIEDMHTVQIIDQTLKENNELKQLFALDLLWTVPLHPWKTTIQYLFNQSTLAIKRGILELNWKNNEIIPDSYILEEILSISDLTPHAIRCASQRGIKNLDGVITPLLKEDSTSIASAAAITILSKNPQNKKSKSVIEKIITDGSQEKISDMISNIQDYPNLISNDNLLKIFINGESSVKNSILKLLKKKPNQIFFEIIFSALLEPSTQKNARMALLVKSKNPYRKKLVAVLINPKSNINSKIQVLKVIDRIEETEPLINIIIPFLNNLDLKILDESCNTLIKISKKIEIDKFSLIQINNSIDQLANRTIQLWNFELSLKNKIHSKLILDHIKNDIHNLVLIIIKLGTLKEPNVPIEDYIRFIETKDSLFLPAVLELVETTFSKEAKRVLLPLIDPDLSIDFSDQSLLPDDNFSTEKTLIDWIQNSHKWKTMIALEYLLKEEKVTLLKDIDWGKINLDIFKHTFFNFNQIDYLSRNFFDKKIIIKRNNNMYSILEKTLILQSVDLFQDIPGEILSNIAQISEEIHMDLEEEVFLDGDNGDSMYVIVEGQISVIKNKKEIALLEQGMCIGEMALLDQEPRSADAICMAESTLLKINQFGFYELMASNHEIMRQIVRILTKRLRETNKKLTSNSR